MAPQRFSVVLNLVTIAVSLLITCMLIDLVCFFFLPPKFTTSLVDYKSNPSPGASSRLEGPASLNAHNLMVNMRYYYRADPSRGFDIAEHATGRFSIIDTSFPIFSNSLGCFDKNDVDTFSSGPYVYFAGDSFTWGYAPYEAKFVTRFEALTGARIAKCGVGHTGTRHEFDKFLSVISKIGRVPKIVFIGFHDNDLQDDYAFPTSTVIDGLLIDTVYVEKPRTLKLYRPPYPLLDAAVKRTRTRGDFAAKCAIEIRLVIGKGRDKTVFSNRKFAELSKKTDRFLSRLLSRHEKL